MHEPMDIVSDDDSMVFEPLVAVTPAHFDQVYSEQFVPMVRFATLMCGRVEVARDIVQDSFVELHLRWANVEYPLAYLRRSVVNGCRSRARWERRRRGRPSAVEASTEQAPDELFDVLASLPTRQRAAIVLKYYEQHTEAEIATILGCRPGTVGSLVSRGMQTMRRALGDENGRMQ